MIELIHPVSNVNGSHGKTVTVGLHSEITPGKAEDFKALAEGTSPICGDVLIGEDLRVYRRTLGLVESIAPCEPRADTEPNVFLDKINWEDFPPLGELAFLFDTFFSTYEREVMMLVGRKRDRSGWAYLVNNQEGNVGGVWWDDEAGIEQLAAKARFVGTLHVHPGNACEASCTDISDWKNPEKSGLHLIFGRNGDYKIYAAIGGEVFRVREGNFSGVERIAVEYETSEDKPLDELLAVRKWQSTKGRTFFGHGYGFFEDDDELGMLPSVRRGVRVPWSSRKTVKPIPMTDKASRIMKHAGEALVIPLKDADNMRIIEHDGKLFIMSADGFDSANKWLEDEGLVVRRLRVNRPQEENQ